MITRTINGIRFEYLTPFVWKYINKKVVKVPDSSRQAGVRLIYHDGTKRTILNSWYDNETIKAL